MAKRKRAFFRKATPGRQWLFWQSGFRQDGFRQGGTRHGLQRQVQAGALSKQR